MCTKGQINQWNRTESPEIDSHVSEYPIPDRERIDHSIYNVG